MAGRALRKLQRQQEENQRLAKLQQDTQEDDDEEEASEDDGPTSSNPVQKSAFELLNEADSEDQSDEIETIEATGDPGNSSDIEAEVAEPAPQPSKKKSKKKKKKKKGNKAATGTPSSTNQGQSADEDQDEIDRALNELRLKEKSSTSEVTATATRELQAFYTLLSVDSKNLNALNEMRKLFGSAVLDSTTDQAENRRRGRDPENMNLETVLAGRYCIASNGQVLSGLALRRNVFVVGKESWPKASTGGLGMEIVEKAWDGTTEYKFVHGQYYRLEQRRFDYLVEGMDPLQMVQNLTYRPYHIATLLQVSEIAKQQGDPAIGADLLERALFSFGRSVQSTFASAMSEGRARLDFRRPENREFWLAASRYIAALGQRGTWRTAYEWSKLLLALDPEGDPYRQRLIVDQLALRGGQFESLVSLAETPVNTIDWGQGLPNIRIGLALAHSKLKHPKEARQLLAECIRDFPWIFAALLKELDVNRIPKSIWGSTPRTPLEQLHTAAYVKRAKDLWNTPETISLLVEVVETAESKPDDAPPADKDAVIDLNDARHVFASDIPELIGYLPRSLTNERTSASDPLPPADDLPSYSTATLDRRAEDEEEDSEMEEEIRNAVDQGPTGIRGLTTGLMNRLGLRLWQPTQGGEGAGETTDGAEGGAQGSERDEGDDAEVVDEQTLRRREEEMLQRVIEQSMAEARQREATDNASRPEGAAAPADAPAPPDPQAEQRWLAGRGLQAVKTFCEAHGADESSWGFGLDSAQAAPVKEYVTRAKAVPRQQRQFILDYALPQGAGREAGDMVKRMLG